MRRLPGLVRNTALLALGFAALPPEAARAQSTTARDALFLVLWETPRFREGEMEALRGLIQAQTTTFPVGSSAGGFSWSFDPQLGLPTRRSQSFGPMFAERPLTTGRRRLNVSLAFQRTDWQSIAGSDLTDLTFQWTDFSEGERFEQYSDLHITTEQTIVNAMFGVTDRIDVGVVVPFVRQSVSGRREFRSVDTFTERPFEQGAASNSGHSSGIGDLTIRGKIGLPGRSVDLATAVDLRLPTGDERQLLGAGGTQATIALLGSRRSGGMAPHFNVGYTFGGGGIAEAAAFGFEQGDFHPSDEFKYTLGTEFMVSAPVTVAADIIGRTMFAAPVPVLLSRNGTYYASQGLSIERGTLNLLLGAISAKMMVSNSWLLTAAIAFPMNSNGLKPGVTPVIGFERAF